MRVNFFPRLLFVLALSGAASLSALAQQNPAPAPLAGQQIKDEFGKNDDTKMLLGLYLKTGGQIDMLGLAPREDF